MKKKGLFIVIVLIIIITIPFMYSKSSYADNFNKSLVINNEKNIKEISSCKIDSNEIIYTSDKSINLVKDNIINLKLALKENESNTSYGLTICFMKVADDMNKDGIISLIGSLDNLNSNSEVLSVKTLDIKSTVTTSFNVKEDGKYIFFVINKDKNINPLNLDVKCEFTIGGENDESDSSIILL